ncbi:hypothetical protein MLD59_08330 [Verrucomicrobiaceae bacterium E54]|nr:hypothetical protein [Verrucomicrobiaceae bacterium E54]
MAVLWVADVCAGPLLAGVRGAAFRRAAGWGGVVALVAATHSVLADLDALERMVGICLVLLGGMKGMVYAEWAQKQRLSFMRYLAFASLWLGMNPGDFRKRLAGLQWKEDAVMGGILFLVGALACGWVWFCGWRQALVMFVPMSLAFHFGWPTAYFAVQGLVTVAERRSGRALGALPTLVVVALPVGWVFPPEFRQQIMERCLGIFFPA